jgi:DNA-binding GntR family transcriptional regulator
MLIVNNRQCDHSAESDWKAMQRKVLGKVNRMTLREQALERLRDGILDGTIPSGERLTEISISEQLGVGRGTVREALRSLEEAGLLQEADRGGMRVRQLSEREVVELYEVRRALEELAVVSLLAHDDVDDRIAKLADSLPETDGRYSAVERLNADLGFHETLCELAGNSILLWTWRQLKDLIRVLILSDSSGGNQHMMTRAWHEPIVDALRTKDAEKAIDTMRTHMEAASERWAEHAAKS